MEERKVTHTTVLRVNVLVFRKADLYIALQLLYKCMF